MPRVRRVPARVRTGAARSTACATCTASCPPTARPASGAATPSTSTSRPTRCCCRCRPRSTRWSRRSSTRSAPGSAGRSRFPICSRARSSRCSDPAFAGLSAAAAAKDAGAGFVMVTGLGSRDGARLAIASQFGADLVVDVETVEPGARVAGRDRRAGRRRRRRDGQGAGRARRRRSRRRAPAARSCSRAPAAAWRRPASCPTSSCTRNCASSARSASTRPRTAPRSPCWRAVGTRSPTSTAGSSASTASTSSCSRWPATAPHHRSTASSRRAARTGARHNGAVADSDMDEWRAEVVAFLDDRRAAADRDRRLVDHADAGRRRRRSRVLRALPGLAAHRLRRRASPGSPGRVEYGGRGGKPWQQAVYREEEARYDVSSGFIASTIALAGAALMTHGTDAQKARYLRPLLRADEVWCQLFSEPDAGSDLANLATRAVRRRRRVRRRRPEGVDVGRAPRRLRVAARAHRSRRAEARRASRSSCSTCTRDGVEVRPLRQMTGAAHFNEVFFHEVRVPRDHIVGEVARRLGGRADGARGGVGDDRQLVALRRRRRAGARRCASRVARRTRSLRQALARVVDPRTDPRRCCASGCGGRCCAASARRSTARCSSCCGRRRGRRAPSSA